MQLTKLTTYLYLIAIGVLVGVAAWILVVGVGFYDLDWRMPLVLIHGGLIYALTLAIRGKMQTNEQKWFVNSVAAITILAAVFPTVGLMQDLVGVKCTGFFNTQSSCFSEWALTPLFVLLNPFAYVLILSISGGPALLEAVSNRSGKKKR